MLAAEAGGDPLASGGFAATRETARHLALWMAFDDIIRVAELKCKAARLDRVRQEVGAQPGDMLRLYDHFKPTVAEFAALLPTGLAARVLRWDRSRTSRGHASLAMPLKLATHSLWGLLALRCLVSIKALRPRGSRYAAEQALIDRWLDAVENGARQSPTLGLEIARCGRLIKGYGATQDRGKGSLSYIVENLATASFDSVASRVAAVASARDAALADDTGSALDKAMATHGVAPRPIREQPVNWVRRRPGGRAGEAAELQAPAQIRE